MAFERIAYPFTAIVGQEELKLALLLNAVNSSIGGLLIRGQKGTGKSTAVRALADLLPEVEVVSGCPFQCSPKDPTNMCENCYELYKGGKPLQPEKRKMRVVTLPIGATEDRVIGSLDIERAIKEGVKALDPGILAETNQSILYVDEVNLLPDHIVDDILDAAASGWNIVEREAISVAHPARFILIGTMNPEEGELRPQLLDRFSLHTAITGIFDKDKRVEIIRRNLEFGEDPLGFRKEFEGQQVELRQKILQARKNLSRVTVTDRLLDAVARVCIQLHVDGHRPDIVMVRSAKALAALEGRKEVSREDIFRVAGMALSHRTRRGGFEEPAKPEQIKAAFDQVLQA